MINEDVLRIHDRGSQRAQQLGVCVTLLQRSRVQFCVLCILSAHNQPLVILGPEDLESDAPFCLLEAPEFLCPRTCLTCIHVTKNTN